MLPVTVVHVDVEWVVVAAVDFPSFSFTTRTRSLTLTAGASTDLSWSSSVSTTQRLRQHSRWWLGARYDWVLTFTCVTDTRSFREVTLPGSHKSPIWNLPKYLHSLVFCKRKQKSFYSEKPSRPLLPVVCCVVLQVYMQDLSASHTFMWWTRGC